MTPAQQQVLFENTARAMGDAGRQIKERHIANCFRADPATVPVNQLVVHSTEPIVPALVAIDGGAGGKLTGHGRVARPFGFDWVTGGGRPPPVPHRT